VARRSAKALRVLETHPWTENGDELLDVVEALLRDTATS
jgi:hypothetical protein